MYSLTSVVTLMSVQMYEFLAPWGVLVPAVSALIVYIASAEQRRRIQLKMMEDQR